MAGGSDEAAAAAGSLVNPNEMRFGSGPPPVVRYAAEARVKKGEDFYLIEPPRQHSSPPYGVFCVFDGHNGMGAALYTKEKIMEAVTEHMPEEVDPDEWLRALPLALAEAFLHLHNDFVATGGQSGTMCTAAVVAGWTVTVAAVGDSRAILDTAGGGVVALSVDHRFETSEEEVARVMKAGGHIARLRTFKGKEVGPLRSWPGGLCMSRSIGDVDCGHHITPLPHVKQIQVPRSGGRLIMASDGLWDAVESERAAKMTRGVPSSSAAALLVKELIKARGLRDDVTVLVVDILPSDTPEHDKMACGVPKSRSGTGGGSGLLSKLKKSKKPDILASASAPDLPTLVNDHDLMKGGTLYQRYMQAGRPPPAHLSVHAGGQFCSGCGEQVRVVDGADAEASIRAGNAFCMRHDPVRRVVDAG